MDRPEAIAWPWAFVFPPTAEEEEQEAEDDVPMFKREAAADTDPPLRPETCAASDRRVTAAAAAEDTAEQEGNAVAIIGIPIIIRQENDEGERKAKGRFLWCRRRQQFHVVRMSAKE